MKAPQILNDLLARVTEVGESLMTRAKARPVSLTNRCEDLLTGAGEATGLALASEILERYQRLDRDEKHAFFVDLHARFGVDFALLAASIDAWQSAPDDTTARDLHFACEPRSQELIRRLNRVPGGTAALVAMRADLLRSLRDEPVLKQLDRDFHHLFSSWFNRGFLELRAIDWSTPAAILEKIIAYEAVHQINGWDDLRRRVAARDRRLYAFFHPALTNEPLIFVEVALARDIPDAIGPVLAEGRDEMDPRDATTAVFYSISNCQPGLRGVSFGNFLIKQVVEELRRQFENLDTFVTLSPVPGLRRWARAQCSVEESALTEAQQAAVALLDPVDGSIEGAAMADAVEKLPGIAARYLVEAHGSQGGAADPVARFHLGNGARLERINPGADHSARGLETAWGVMVNYLYHLADIEKNHEAYATLGEIKHSPSVRHLLRAR
ncbi:MAG: malonyl-CoA decarboxylase [Pseudomonadota bacterium]